MSTVFGCTPRHLRPSTTVRTSPPLLTSKLVRDAGIIPIELIFRKVWNTARCFISFWISLELNGANICSSHLRKPQAMKNLAAYQDSSRYYTESGKSSYTHFLRHGRKVEDLNKIIKCTKPAATSWLYFWSPNTILVKIKKELINSHLCMKHNRWEVPVYLIS